MNRKYEPLDTGNTFSAYNRVAHERGMQILSANFLARLRDTLISYGTWLVIIRQDI